MGVYENDLLEKFYRSQPQMSLRGGGRKNINPNPELESKYKHILVDINNDLYILFNLFPIFFLVWFGRV
jgi:hypothetical protein